MNINEQKIAAGLRAIQPEIPLFFLTTDHISKTKIFGFDVFLIPESYMHGFWCRKNDSYFSYMPVFNKADSDSIVNFLEAAIEYEPK